MNLENRVKLASDQETPLMKVVHKSFKSIGITRAVIPGFTSDYQNFRNGIELDIVMDKDNKIFCDDLTQYLERYDKTPEEIMEYEKTGCISNKRVSGIPNAPEILNSCKKHFEKIYNDPCYSLIYYNGNFYIRKDLFQDYMKKINTGEIVE